MTKTTAITPLELPSVALDERAALPDTPAAYFVLEGDIVDVASLRAYANRPEGTARL